MTNGADSSPAGRPESQASERLDSWKEIAAYLKREVRTAQRWEKNEGLPVHRHQHEKLGTVYAYKSEIDAWWRERRVRLEEQPEAVEPADTEEVQVETEELPKPSVTPQWRLAAIVVVSLLVAAAVVAYLIRKPPPPPRDRGKLMLAVLPFANLSGDQSQEPIADGLTEEMITELGRLQPERLGVIARTTAMQYKSTPKSAEEIGQELGVQYILEGSVRRAENQIRINAKLIQVSDQSPIWVETYNRELREILKVEAEVAVAIANQIQVKLTPSPITPRPVNPEAHEAYLKGRFYWYKRDLPSCINYYNQAIALDPNYALAYAGLASAYVLLGSAPTAVMPPREARPKAKEAATKALQLDPKLDEAQIGRASCRERV